MEKIEFYPYNFSYRIKENRTFILIHAKWNDKKIKVMKEHQPFFYLLLENKNREELEKKLQKILEIARWEEDEKELIGKKVKVLRIFTRIPKDVPIAAKALQDKSLSCHEKDILFVHRYIRDLGLIPMTRTAAEGNFSKEDESLFEAEKISNVSEETVQWKTLALDIETYGENIDPERNPILMIAFYGNDSKKNEFMKVITWKVFPNNLDYLEIVKDEKEMIMRFKEILESYDPEIITGYFSDGFDLPYLKTRASKYRIDLPIETGKRQEQAEMENYLHIDVFKFVRNIFGKNLKVENFKLDSIANELLGHKKHVVDILQLSRLWDNSSEKLEEYCQYNLHDARLAGMLCDKLLFDMIEFTKIVGLPLFDVIRMSFSRLVESYILKRAREYNVLAPNRPENQEIEERMRESIEGAFVYQPTPGLYSDIVVFDFRSLYPTIITAHNIGPESFHCSCCKDNEHVPGMEQYWFCGKENKFIPTVLKDIIIKRSAVKEKAKKSQGEEKKTLEARSYALKILANSFYGYLGFYGARWYCLECAASTTAYARNYIKMTISKAEEKSFSVIYADTDSCFLLLGTKSKKEALGFMEEVNSNLPGQMELEFEGYFPRGIFVAAKGTGIGAKKKYALIREDKTMKITGFEVVRRNWSDLSREVQKEVLRLALEDKKEEALRYVKETVKDLQESRIPLQKLIIKTQITRELSQYSSQGPHVAVAQKMRDRGMKVEPGMVVEYVIEKGSGLIRERASIPSEAKGYDFGYYLNNQILPAVLSIMSVLGYSEEDILNKSKQVGLNKFF